MDNDTLIHYGGEIKNIEESPDGWKFGGYLVVFDSTDVSSMRDRFTKSTDFDIQNGDRRSVYYNHGMDGTVKRTRLGDCRVQVKDAGIWIEGEIKKRSDYLAKHAEQIAMNIKQFGLSSGAPAHLVERKDVEGGHEVTLWPIAEASITPTPAEPMTGCVSLKSLMDVESEEAVKGTLLEMSAKSTNTLLADAVKALPKIGAYAVTSAAVDALTGLGKSALYMIQDLMNPDYVTYDDDAPMTGTSTNYTKPSLEEKKAAAQKIIDDFSSIAMSLFITMSQNAATLTEIKNITDLTDSLPDGLTLEDHSLKVLAAVKEIEERVASLKETRCIKSQRRWSADNYARFNQLADGLSQAAEAIKAHAGEYAPRDEAAEAAKQRDAEIAAYADYQLTVAKMNGVTI